MNIAIDNNLISEEVTNLRKVSGWDHDEKEWDACLKQNIINVSARDDEGKVV